MLPEDGNPRMNGSKISIEKYMVTIILGVYGLLPQGVSYGSKFF